MMTDAMREVRRAWNVTGPRPDIHAARQANLMRDWPVLAKAVKRLADIPAPSPDADAELRVALEELMADKKRHVILQERRQGFVVEDYANPLVRTSELRKLLTPNPPPEPVPPLREVLEQYFPGQVEQVMESIRNTEGLNKP